MRPEAGKSESGREIGEAFELRESPIQKKQAATRPFGPRCLVKRRGNLDEAVQSPADFALLDAPRVLPGLVRLEVMAGIEEDAPPREPLRRLRGEFQGPTETEEPALGPAPRTLNSELSTLASRLL
jgi:hypothetical protein